MEKEKVKRKGLIGTKSCRKNGKEGKIRNKVKEEIEGEKKKEDIQTGNIIRTVQKKRTEEKKI